jgi:hypothetical protein
MFDCGEGTQHQASIHAFRVIVPFACTNDAFPNQMPKTRRRSPQIINLSAHNLERMYAPGNPTFSLQPSYLNLQFHNAHAWRPLLWIACEPPAFSRMACQPFLWFEVICKRQMRCSDALSFSPSACSINAIEQGFMHSMNLKPFGQKPAVAAGGGAAESTFEPDEEHFEVNDFSSSQKFFEIVGPQHLATFLRTSFFCSDSHFPWNYHVTELLPAGSPVPHVDTLHDNEAPTTFILPDSDGTYTVLAGHPSGVTVRAVALTHRVFCLGYALTEPQRPGK